MDTTRSGAKRRGEKGETWRPTSRSVQDMLTVRSLRGACGLQLRAAARLPAGQLRPAASAVPRPVLTAPAAAAAQDSLARMEADGEQKRQNSAAEKVKVLFASAASDKVLPEGGALTMKGSAARIGWTHVLYDMTSRWDTMMVIQDSKEMLDDGKNIMTTCGVLAALIL
eukprot:COSAG04_NODE_10635_length_762_cov_1.282051_2_plen_168_part_01